MNEWTFTLSDPDNLQIVDNSGDIYFGCDQEWFGSDWQRMSGCGPSVASNILLYLHRAKSIILPFDINNKSDGIKLMETVWHHVTPTQKGLYLIDQFCNGMLSFTQAIGYGLECNSLDIPQKSKVRPELSMIVRFIVKGLLVDCPIAFLNLSNGKVSNLDRWHWVTIISLETDQNNDTTNVMVYDGAKSIVVDLKLWHETTTLGGSFVYFDRRPKNDFSEQACITDTSRTML